MDNIFLAYAMECEGDLPTRTGRLNKVVKELVEFVRDTGAEEISTEYIDYLLDKYDLDNLSEYEQNYLQAELNFWI